MMQQLNSEKLLVEGCVEGSYEKVLQAFTLNKTVPSMNVAKAANIEKPIENYNGSDRFSASLGVGALTEQAKILDSMTLDEYQPKLVDLKVAIKRLKE